MKESEILGVTKKDMPVLQLVDESKEFVKEESDELENSDVNIGKLVE